MKSPDQSSNLESDICIHIFTVSAGMVGVCLTVIGILQVAIRGESAVTLADDYLAVDAILFLISCMLSYWALRTRSSLRLHRVERIADGVFLTALLLMVGMCFFITYTLAIR